MSAIFVSLAMSERYERLANAQFASFGDFPHVQLMQHCNPPPGSPRNLSLPWLAYCAKPFAIQAARKVADIVVWIDAACRIVANPDPLFSHIGKHGYYIQDNGFKMGQWCSDAALKTLAITRDQAMDIPEISTMAIGFDFRDKRCVSFLDEWCDLASDGVTFMAEHTNDIGSVEAAGLSQRSIGHVSDDPRVYGHRHDQTAASVLAWRRDWKMTARPVFSDYFNSAMDSRTIIVNAG